MFDLIRIVLIALAALGAASPVVIRSIISLIRRRRVAAGKPEKRAKPSKDPAIRPADNGEEQELSEPQVAMRRIYRMTRTPEERDRWEQGSGVPSTVKELYATDYQSNLSQKKGGMRRIRRLPPLKQAIAWSEVLGKPVSERDENSWD